jgi:hypothetical protein
LDRWPSQCMGDGPSVQNSSPLPRACCFRPSRRNMLHRPARVCATLSKPLSTRRAGCCASHCPPARGEKATSNHFNPPRNVGTPPPVCTSRLALIGSPCAAMPHRALSHLSWPSVVIDLGCTQYARKDCLSARNRRHAVRRELVPKRRPPREALGCRIDHVQTACAHSSSSAAFSIQASFRGLASSAKRKVDGRRGVPGPLQRRHRTGIATRVLPWVGLPGTAIVRFAA